MEDIRQFRTDTTTHGPCWVCALDASTDTTHGPCWVCALDASGWKSRRAVWCEQNADTTHPSPLSPFCINQYDVFFTFLWHINNAFQSVLLFYIYIYIYISGSSKYMNPICATRGTIERCSDSAFWPNRSGEFALSHNRKKNGRESH